MENIFILKRNNSTFLSPIYWLFAYIFSNYLGVLQSNIAKPKFFSISSKFENLSLREKNGFNFKCAIFYPSKHAPWLVKHVKCIMQTTNCITLKRGLCLEYLKSIRTSGWDKRKKGFESGRKRATFAWTKEICLAMQITSFFAIYFCFALQSAYSFF